MTATHNDQLVGDGSTGQHFDEAAHALRGVLKALTEDMYAFDEHISTLIAAAHAHAVLAQVEATCRVGEEIRGLRLALTATDPDDVSSGASPSGAVDDIAACIERYVGGAQ